jgi:hypothetical protein
MRFDLHLEIEYSGAGTHETGWDVAERPSAIAAAHPSIFRRRYARKNRSADEQDANTVARWHRETRQTGTCRSLSTPSAHSSRDASR